MSNAREQILQTTCALLEKQGYHGTGLNEIIKESGSPKGSLYYYFPEGKEQITAEAVLQSGGQTAERIRQGLTESSNAAKAVSDFILNIAEHVERSGFAAGSPLTAVAMRTGARFSKPSWRRKSGRWLKPKLRSPSRKRSGPATSATSSACSTACSPSRTKSNCISETSKPCDARCAPCASSPLWRGYC